jgi:hypothetical protein
MSGLMAPDASSNPTDFRIKWILAENDAFDDEEKGVRSLSD